MKCKSIYLSFLLALLLLPAYGQSLTFEQTVTLRGLSLRYEANQIQLSQELRVLNQSLEALYQESNNLKKQTEGLKISLRKSQFQVQALVGDLENMDTSIQTLENSLKRTAFMNKLLKYGLAASVTAVIVEAVIIALR